MSDALFRLVGDGDRYSGGAIPLPDAFSAVVNELLAHGDADFRKLNSIISDALRYKEDRIMAAAWRSWPQFTTDILTVLEEMNLIQGNDSGKWELTGEFAEEHTYYLPGTKIGFTGRSPEKLERWNGNEALHMALNDAVNAIKDRGGKANPEAVRMVLEAEKILVRELGLDRPVKAWNNPRGSRERGPKLRKGLTAFFRDEFWEKHAVPGVWYALSDIAVRFSELHRDQPPVDHSDLTGSMRKAGREMTAAGVLESEWVIENGARKWKFRRKTNDVIPGNAPNAAVVPVVTWEGLRGDPKVRWAEPPASKNRWPGRAWEEEAGKLREHPGEWACIKTIPVTCKSDLDKGRGLAHEIRIGKHIVFRPAGSFQAKSRVETEGDVKVINVYARYVGGSDA